MNADGPSNAENASVDDQLADWIDPYVIASCLVEELAENGEKPTVERGKQVWLRALERLHCLIRSSL